MDQADSQSCINYLRNYFVILGGLLALAFLVLLPYGFWWLYASGDAAVERVAQTQAKGEFALFGSALSQDFADYKLRLYAAARPEIIALGSSRVMQFRGGWFMQSFVNMGGAVGNIGMLQAVINALLAIHRPKAIILGLDFWWFLPQWEKLPAPAIELAENSYNYSFMNLKKPWQWLFEGKISLKDFLAPITGLFGYGFRADRYGIMAQQTNDGFGPDGSWYYTAEITGQKQPQDYLFADTLTNVRRGLRAFYHAAPDQKGPAESHLEALAELWCRLKSRNIQIFAFIPPLAGQVLEAMAREKYPHLYNLRAELAARGIDVIDFTNPKIMNAGDCEFIDGFHGGEVVYARILLRMADHWPALLPYVNVEKLERVISDWQGYAFVEDMRLTNMPEMDFLGLGCKKIISQPVEPQLLDRKGKGSPKQKGK